MSRKNQHFFQQEFNSWGDALNAYIIWEHGQKRGSRKWLAKKLLGEDAPKSKVKSKSSEIGRWINEGVTPIERTQDEINNKINGRIFRNEQGLWKISRTEGEEYMEKYTRGVDEEPDLNGLTPESAAQEAARRLKSGEFSEDAEDRLLQAVLKMQQGIQLTLDQLVRLRKESKDDDPDNSQ